MNRISFKYNMSFYYQSTIIYFVVFILYLVIRGEFIEGAYRLITRDPIIYFLGLIVIISVLSLLYNIYKNRHMEITDSEIIFISRFRKKVISFADITYIKMFRERLDKERRALRLITIGTNKRRRPVIIRPYDYENESELIAKFREIKQNKSL